MIFFKLFLVFSKIGIVNFGGGYAMLSLIQDEVVRKEGWLSSGEFTDIVAVSQMTPGPLGINIATYVGYTSVLNDGYPRLLHSYTIGALAPLPTHDRYQQIPTEA